MPLTTTARIVTEARAGHHGAAAFNAALLEQLDAVLTGAAVAGAPVIVQVSENAVAYRGSLRPPAAAALEAPRAGPVPAALHLERGRVNGGVRERSPAGGPGRGPFHATRGSAEG